jgi:hypothetical protein
VLPQLVFDARIIARAKAGQVPANGYRTVTLLGGAAFGFMTQIAVLALCGNATPVLVGLCVLIGGSAGAAVVAGICYQYLRMRAARDPDYGPLDPPTDVDPAARPED